MSQNPSSDDPSSETSPPPKDDPRAAFEFALGDETFEGHDSIESTDSQSAGPELKKGDQIQYIGDYEVRSEIASGAMGVVYRGLQRSLKRDVAIKMIHTSLAKNAGLRQRFRIEAEAVAALDHPNIVPIYEVGEHEGHLYFSMRHLSGGCLANRLVTNDWESFDRRQLWAAQIVITIARAIHHAHQRGILHRDLKPSNVLLDEFDAPVITDFGLAKFADKESDLTRSQATLGTPAYMSPEQALGRSREISVASDVYSLGAILFELLTGRPPFTGESHLEIMKKTAEESPIALRGLQPDVAPDLEVICLKTLSKPPRLRYASALEFAEDLERWMRGDAIHARPVGLIERLWLWAQRRPALASAWALIVLLILLVLVGLPAGIFQINQARIAEQAERQRSEQLLNQSRLAEADRLLDEGESGKALAYLAAVAKAEPDNQAVTEKLIYNLTYRNWVLPEKEISRGDSVPDIVKLSPDGKWIVGIYPLGNAEIHQLETGTVHSFRHEIAEANQLLFHPSDHKMVIQGASSMGVFEMPVGARIGGPFTLEAALGPGFSDPFGQRLFFRSGDWKNVVVYSWGDLSEIPWSLECSDRLSSLEFRPGQQEVAVIDGEGLRVWAYLTGELVFGPVPNLKFATYSADGDWILVGETFRPASGEGFRQQLAGYQVLDANTGTARAKISAVGQLSLIDAGSEGEFPLLNLSSKECWFQFVQHKDQLRPVGRLALDQPSPGGQRILRQELRHYHPGQSFPNLYPLLRSGVSGLPILSDAEGQEIFFSSSGGRMELWNEEQRRSQLWDAARLKPLFEQTFGSPMFDMADVKGERTITQATGKPPMLWQAIETAARPSILSELRSVEKAQFFKRGEQIATLDVEGLLRVFTAAELAPISVSERPMVLKRFSRGAGIEYLEFLEGLEVLAIGTRSDSVQLWNGTTSEPLSEVMILPDRLQSLHWLPDKKRLVTLFGQVTQSAWVWDIESGKQLLEADGWEVPPCLAIGNGGELLMLRVGEQQVRIWDVMANEWHGEVIDVGHRWPQSGGNRTYAGSFSQNSGLYFTRGPETLTVGSLADPSQKIVIESDLLRSPIKVNVQFIEGGKGVLIATNEGFVVHDSSTGRSRFPGRRLNNLTMARVFPDGEFLITASHVGEGQTQVNRWNLQSGLAMEGVYRQTGSIEFLEVSEDGSRSLLVSDHEAVLLDARNQIVLWRHPFNRQRRRSSSRNPLEAPMAYLSPDGERVLVLNQSLARPLTLWAFPRFEEITPRFLPELAESVGQFRLASDGSLQTVSPNRYLELRMEDRSDTTPSDMDRWLIWFLAPSEQRPISPFSEMSSSEYLRRLVKSDTLAGLLETLRREPDHPEARERLASVFDLESENWNQAEAMERAGDLLLAFESILKNPAQDHEFRISSIETVLSNELFGELRLLTDRISQSGLTNLLRAWIDGSLSISRRFPKESYSGEEMIRAGNLISQRNDRRRTQTEWWTLGVQELTFEIERLGRLLRETEATLASLPNPTRPHSPEPKETTPVPADVIKAAAGPPIGYSVDLETGSNLIAVQVVQGENRLSDLIPDVPLGTSVVLLEGTRFLSSVFNDGWGELAGYVLTPGQGLILVSKVPGTLEFKGQPVDETQPRILEKGQHLIGNRLPAPASFQDIVGRQPKIGEKLHMGVPEGQGEVDYQRYEFKDSGWEPSEPRLEIGEAAIVELAAPSQR